MFTSLRPEIELPTRKTMSTRILDEGAAIAWKKLSKIMEDSDGKPVAIADKMGQSDSSHHQTAAVQEGNEGGPCEIIATLANRDQRDKAEELFSVVETDVFWYDLQHMVPNMLPIRVALRTLEADSARLDQVLDQFGRLANHFSYSAPMTAALETRCLKMHMPCTQPDS